MPPSPTKKKGKRKIIDLTNDDDDDDRWNRPQPPPPPRRRASPVAQPRLRRSGTSSSSSSSSSSRLTAAPSPSSSSSLRPGSFPSFMSSSSSFSSSSASSSSSSSSSLRAKRAARVEGVRGASGGAGGAKGYQISRAQTQRMYLVERDAARHPPPRLCRARLDGNVYTVQVCQHPVCDCPDFDRGYLCKHLLFVYLKVLRLSSDDPLVWQTSLLRLELASMLQLSSDPRATANRAVVKTYRAIVRTQSGEEAGENHDEDEDDDDDEDTVVRQKPLDGASCPICFDAFRGRSGADAVVVWCRASCGNNIHAACFEKWRRAKLRTGARVDCVCCRAAWVAGDTENAPAAPAVGSREGYLNMGGLARLPTVRDTSSYKGFWRDRYEGEDYEDDEDNHYYNSHYYDDEDEEEEENDWSYW
ncbi:hypothetical protein DFJ73DRAFT_796772 [Zopfochytrium polystomum]|nr:hypothetical protein DFJ73DRAFT_796772 [Zopfochytrium polystomum]